MLSARFAEAAAILGVIGYLCFRYGRRPIRQFSLAHNEPLKGESNASFPAWLSRHEWTFALLVGIVCIPLILRVQILATMIVAYQHPTLEGLRQSKDSFLMFGLAARAIVTAPIFEEFLYRGLIQGGLQRINRRLNPPVESLLMGDDPRLSALLGTKANLNESPPATWPILVSSAIFAAAHWNLGASCIPLFLFGLVLGFLFRRSGNLVSCILVHAMLNSYSIALVLLR